MNKKRLLVVQIIGELAIPLLGFFLWNWSLYFILLYYIIENLFSAYFQIETSRRLYNLAEQKKASFDFIKLLLFLCFWLVEVLLIHLFLYLSDSTIQFSKQIIEFFMYEDLGIPQGILLLPLLFFASSLKMKQDIQLFSSKINSIDDLKKFSPKFTYYVVSIGFWLFLLVINSFMNIPEIVTIPLLLFLFVYRSLNRT